MAIVMHHGLPLHELFQFLLGYQTLVVVRAAEPTQNEQQIAVAQTFESFSNQLQCQLSFSGHLTAYQKPHLQGV